ncbi:MAG: VCBS repeat-containing protein [bacterium]|nr:VCBS repeat-containing protein [bacterium]
MASLLRSVRDRIAAGALVALAVLPASAQDAHLTPPQDPSEPWVSEELAARAASRLADLARALEGGTELEAVLEGLCGPEVAGVVLRPESTPLVERGDFRVRRDGPEALSAAAGEAEPLAAALATLFAPFAGAEELHVHFKVIAVEERQGAEATLVTDVLYASSAKLGAGGVQQNALWEIGWRAVDDDLRIVALVPRGLDEVHVARRPFVERTRAALGRAGASAAVLGRGAGEWGRRIDHVGEPNFFGHNGIAVGDVDGDGREDVYVGTGTGLPNLLFVQRPDGTFEERAHASQAAWLDDTKGVLLIDYDNDGDRDLFIAMGPSIVLSENDGKGKFTPVRNLRAASGAAFYSLAAADYDLDGDLDVYGVRYVKTRYGDSVPRPFHDARNGPANHLLRNDGAAGFTDVTHEVGLAEANDRFSLAAGWSDYDADGDPDLYVANDFGRNNLFENDGGKFVDVAARASAEDQAAGMGVAWGDVDLDGDFDLLVSNMFSSAGRRVGGQPRFHDASDAAVREGTRRHALGNTLLLNDGTGAFVDASDAAGLRMGRWAWGARFTDFDHDGLPDVLVPNGFLTGTEPDDL